MIDQQILEEVLVSNEQAIGERASAIIPRAGIVIPQALEETAVFYGVRRSGKTYILYDLFLKEGGRALYVDLEDDRLRGFTLADFGRLRPAFLELKPHLAGQPLALFLDEVQNVDGWERFCRRATEREKLKVYVTGSSSRMMPAEIHTALRGRSWSLEVLPFSFSEFLAARGVPAGSPVLRHGPSAETIKRHFTDYRRWGGFPEAARLAADFERRKLLGEYYAAMYFRDLVERYGVTNVSLLDALSDRLFSSFAAKFSLTAFYNQYKGRLPFSKDLLFRYYRHYLDSFLVYEARKFSESTYVRQRNPAKIYPIDPGLCRRVTSQDEGRLLETVVYLELHRRGLEVFYFEDRRECDFVSRDRDGKLSACQVCHELTEQNRERELAGLAAACRHIGAGEGLLLTSDEEREVETAGLRIHVLPVWKWCLT